MLTLANLALSEQLANDNDDLKSPLLEQRAEGQRGRLFFFNDKRRNSQKHKTRCVPGAVDVREVDFASSY